MRRFKLSAAWLLYLVTFAAPVVSAVNEQSSPLAFPVEETANSIPIYSLDTESTPVSTSSADVAAPNCYFWLEHIQHRGKAAFNPDSSYQVYRNVKDFGARGA